MSLYAPVWKVQNDDKTRLVFTRRSAHLIITRSPRMPDMFIVKWRIYRKNLSDKPVVYGWRHFSGFELIAAFGIRSNNWLQKLLGYDPNYTKDIKVSSAVFNKFARTKNILSIPDPKNAPLDKQFIIEVKPFMKKAVKGFVST